jgi:hypothetical protein
MVSLEGHSMYLTGLTLVSILFIVAVSTYSSLDSLVVPQL